MHSQCMIRRRMTVLNSVCLEKLDAERFHLIKYYYHELTIENING